MNTLLKHRPRLRQVRGRVRTGVRRGADAAYRVLRRMPMPPAVRTSVAYRPGLVEVPLDRVLLGGQEQLGAEAYAAALGDPRWSSTRVVDGPHVALLRAAEAAGRVDAEVLRDSGYARMAQACLAATGRYFSATDEAGVLTVAERFVAHAHGLGDDDRLPGQSPSGEPVRLAPVRDSDCHQVVDGHHRIAAAWVAGERVLPARVKRMPVSTGLQETLDAMSWIGGERELYQPIDAPELEQAWTTVRRCTDRLEAMHGVVAELGLEPERTSYLDVASCYGWFVAQMAAAGHPSQGVERDPLARRLGETVYGLATGRISTGDAVDFLHTAGRRWDVVSCFSLLHHFVLGRGSCGPEELVRLLDAVTGRVLLLDTGQEHEAWFADSLAGWDAERVADFLGRHGSFDRVVDLGPDRDAVPPYQQNYGRHLFACLKDR